MDMIEPEHMVFVGNGGEGVGAVREVRADAIVVWVENAGEMVVPRSAIRAAHDKKVVLEPGALDRRFLEAIGHLHDREDPEAVGGG